MPRQKPGKSKQDVQTPPELLRAIERVFGVGGWVIDLAANEHNSVSLQWLGPGAYDPYENSLAVNWSMWSGDAFLNPPYADISPWVQKCLNTKRAGRIFALVPAAVGSNWYREYVDGSAHVVALSPRVTFVGHRDPYPKDLILAIYSAVRGGFSTWRWK